VGQSSAAVTSTGMNASLTVTSSSSQQVNLTGTVTNNTPNPASNWQVAVALNNSTLSQSPNNAEANMIGGQAVFSPNSNASVLQPGSSTTFTFTVKPTSTSNFTPTIALVDGVANGTYGVGLKATGVDAIAQTAATTAINVAVAYENNKLANNGDANYLQYDNLLWTAQSYAISGSTIVFDPNMPGYAFIPNQAKAELAFAQQNASVAAYLVDGLQSCFIDTSSNFIFNFRAQILKGLTSGTTTTGSINGVVFPAADYHPSGYNVNTVVDNYSTVGLGKGGTTITSTLTSENSSSAVEDFWFGILTYTYLNAFSNTTAVAAKYGPQGTAAACSPFNGPGGTANPYFTITLNGSQVAARFQGVGAQGYNINKSTIVIDPVAYMTAGVQFDASGYELGPQINPFSLNPASMYAVSQNDAMWAIETSGGVQTWGQFTQPVTLFGVTKYQFVDQGAIPPGTTFDP
jgi:hypothetical protein